MKENISEIIGRIIKLKNSAKNSLVQQKVQRASAAVKRARTMLENAEKTLDWAEQYERNGGGVE